MSAAKPMEVDISKKSTKAIVAPFANLVRGIKQVAGTGGETVVSAGGVKSIPPAGKGKATNAPSSGGGVPQAGGIKRGKIAGLAKFALNTEKDPGSIREFAEKHAVDRESLVSTGFDDTPLVNMISDAAAGIMNTGREFLHDKLFGEKEAEAEPIEEVKEAVDESNEKLNEVKQVIEEGNQERRTGFMGLVDAEKELAKESDNARRLQTEENAMALAPSKASGENEEVVKAEVFEGGLSEVKRVIEEGNEERRTGFMGLVDAERELAAESDRARRLQTEENAMAMTPSKAAVKSPEVVKAEDLEEDSGGGIMSLVSSSKPIKALMNILKSAKGMLTMVFSLITGPGLTAIKFLLGKAGPIAAIIGVVSFITGFVDIFSETGDISEGLKGGIMNVVGVMIDAPLNMLKDLVSWILGIFGFEGAAKALDSFDFDLAGMIGDVFDFMMPMIDIMLAPLQFIIDFISGFMEGGLFGGIKKAWGGLIETIVDAPLNFMKDIVSAILAFFGFEDAASAVNSFDFDLAGGFTRFFDGIIGFFSNLWTGLQNMWNDVVEVVASMAEAIPFIGEGLAASIRGKKIEMRSEEEIASDDEEELWSKLRENRKKAIELELRHAEERQVFEEEHGEGEEKTVTTRHRDAEGELTGSISIGPATVYEDPEVQKQYLTMKAMRYQENEELTGDIFGGEEEVIQKGIDFEKAKLLGYGAKEFEAEYEDDDSPLHRSLGTDRNFASTELMGELIGEAEGMYGEDWVKQEAPASAGSKISYYDYDPETDEVMKKTRGIKAVQMGEELVEDRAMDKLEPVDVAGVQALPVKIEEDSKGSGPIWNRAAASAVKLQAMPASSFDTPHTRAAEKIQDSGVEGVNIAAASPPPVIINQGGGGGDGGSINTIMPHIETMDSDSSLSEAIV